MVEIWYVQVEAYISQSHPTSLMGSTENPMTAPTTLLMWIVGIVQRVDCYRLGSPPLIMIRIDPWIYIDPSTHASSSLSSFSSRRRRRSEEEKEAKEEEVPPWIPLIVWSHPPCSPTPKLLSANIVCPNWCMSVRRSCPLR